MTTWTCSWHLKCGWSQSCGTQPVSFGVWHCLQVDSDIIELKCRTLAGIHCRAGVAWWGRNFYTCSTWALRVEETCRCFLYQRLENSPEKAMAPRSSTLAWKIPWTEEPGGLQSMGSRLSDFTFTFHFHALEKEMATHSSVLAWRIPGMAEPGGLPSMGSQSRTRLKRLSSSSIEQSVIPFKLKTCVKLVYT